MLRSVPLALLCAVLSSCGPEAVTDGSAPTPGASGSVLQESWMYLVAGDPGRMAPYEQGATGDAWLAFFHNDLQRAADLFGKACRPSDDDLATRVAVGAPCVGLARTQLELAEMYATLGQVDRVAVRQFYSHRIDNPEKVLPSVQQPFFEGITLLHSGDREGGLTALAAYQGGDALLTALARQIADGVASGDPLVGRVWLDGSEAAPPGAGFGGLPTSEATSAYAARLAFMAAVAQDETAAARALFAAVRSRQADLHEELPSQDENGLKPRIFHHDTAFLRSLSRYHALEALAASRGPAELSVFRAAADRLLGRPGAVEGDAPKLEPALSFVLFSSVPSPADLFSGERSSGLGAPTLSRLGGLHPTLASAPSPDLGDLDAFIEGSNMVTRALGDLLGQASAAGANLNTDMGLAERFRGQLLKERTVQYQEAFDVRLDKAPGADLASAGVAARSLLELAMDKNPSPPHARLKRARISYRNDPPLLAALARAHLDTRHPYDANEYVRPLSEVYGALVPVREALAAIDSAWNPARKGSVR